MYVILVYDVVVDENGAYVSRHLFKIAKKYLTHIQKSVFEGELSKLDYMKLKTELDYYIRRDRDAVLLFHSRSDKWLKKEFLGLVDDKTSRFF